MPADSSDKNQDTKYWANRLHGFLNDPEHGVFFFEELIKRIAGSVPHPPIPQPGSSSKSLLESRWYEAVSSSPEFNEAFDLVRDRLLTPDGFHNAMKSHGEYTQKKLEEAKKKGLSESPTVLSEVDWMLNRVTMVVSKLRTDRRDQPGIRLRPDEHIEATADKGAKADAPIPFSDLCQAIARLSKQHQAATILRIWPLPEFPESWRECFLSVICDVGEINGLQRDEVIQRLDTVTKRYAPVKDEALLKLESRLGTSLASERHFDSLKRNNVGQLESLGQAVDRTGGEDAETLLGCDCRTAVGKTSVRAVLADFGADDIYGRRTSGLRFVKDRALAIRRRFSRCCYKQKYHRRVWLNASVKLSSKQPANGTMTHEDIAYVLNCPVGSCYANLSRGRENLFGGQIGDEADLQAALPTDPEGTAKPDFFEQELDDDRLSVHVCSDLRPAAKATF